MKQLMLATALLHCKIALYIAQCNELSFFYADFIFFKKFLCQHKQKQVIA